jgi:hypothetical protein
MARPNSIAAPPTPQPATTGKTEARPVKYVVVRDGHRVSDREYDSPTDPLCEAEIKFWSRVSKNRSYGEKVEAVQYDSKKHRVFSVGTK